jgi:hypothetical protein
MQKRQKDCQWGAGSEFILYPQAELGIHLLPSCQKNIDSSSILITVRDLFFNRRGAESAEGIKKKLIYSL